MTGFASLLNELQRKSGRSQRAVALAADLDPGRYSRLLSDERAPATREQVLALASALAVSEADADRLVAKAGYLPPRLEQLGIDDPAIVAILAALTRPSLDEASRQALRRTIVAIAEHWT